MQYSGRPKAALYFSGRSMAQLDVSLKYNDIFARAGTSINASVFVDDEGLRPAGTPPLSVVAEAWSARAGKLLHTQSWSVALPSQQVVEVRPAPDRPPVCCTRICHVGLQLPISCYF